MNLESTKSTMDTEVVSKCKKLIVAAIYIGTTNSGYAFSNKYYWGNVITNNWQGGSLLSHKAPTCLLLKKDQSVSLFGYEAEDRYSELTADDNKEHENYYFFQRFKMILYEDMSVSRHILCKDIKGKTLKAGTVFLHCIKYLKNHLICKINKKFSGIKEDDIDFVLTLPAILGDNAEMFIREAATKAGIKKERLIVALEPEAASIYCQYLHIANNDASSALGVVNAGTKYMLLDLGGDTADITVHQKCEDNTLEEVLPASRGPWGGKSVDEAFIKFLTELVGEKVMGALKKEYMEDYLQIVREFETKKRILKPSISGRIYMTISQVFFMLSKEMHNVKDFTEVIERNTKHKDNVKYASGKLILSYSYFTGFFKKTIESIVKHIDELFEEDMVRDVEIIVMVGGFSECMLVQNAIKKNFEHKNVIVPEESGLAVLKGAVFFGHVPDAISRRSARYTYGIKTWPEFRPGYHLESKKVPVRGSIRCQDVFFKVITKGEKIMPGYTKSQIFQAPNSEEKCLECGIFISDQKDPTYVDEQGCRLLGVLQVPLSIVGKQTSCEIEESLIFGETELRFKARNVYTSVQREVIFDLLKH